jgi:uncharacterized protein (TIGR03083 family)
MTGKATQSAAHAAGSELSVAADRLGLMVDFMDRISADSARLAEVAHGHPGARVPSCPDWTVADLLVHVSAVYLHKVEAIRRNAQPTPWPPDFSGRDPLELYDEARSALLAELGRRRPDEPAWTFWPDDQTCAFWFRRMAHETAVHRIDAEQAAGAVTPVDAELATDGVDEVLRVMLCGPWWGAGDTAEPVDAIVRLSTGDRSWTVTVDARNPTVAEGIDTDVAAEISGEPGDLFLWLWGRRAEDAVRFAGDPDVVRRFRRRLAECLT